MNKEETVKSKPKKSLPRYRLKLLLIALPVIIPLSLVYTPIFWVNLLMFIDFYTPWVLFESPLYDKYHNFLVNRLQERSEEPLIEISAENATMENIVKLSKSFTW